ncbi:O-antigen ligase family protein [Enterococcus sp. DIV1411a]|uniref:O-antigen ligase family protein n=1 Tax=Enterococcus sp. DIV1411a TaxID=2774779 RepID=UPI003D300E28
MYFLVFLLHGLIFNIPSLLPITFAVSAMFFFITYKKMKKHVSKMSSRFLILMCYALPFSWRNLFGGDYGSLPISWFYLFGFMFIISLFFSKHDWNFSKRLFPIFITAFLSLIYSFLPLVISNWSYRSQAVSQFIVILFNFIMVIGALFRNRSLTELNLTTFKKVFILGGYYTALMLIIQFVLYRYVGFEFGKIDFLLNRELFYYLFSDVSHGTLYLALTIFCAFDFLKTLHGKEKNKYIFFMLVSLIGCAVTSARTGLYVLFVFLFLYILIKQKGFVRKFVSVIAFIILITVAFKLLMIVRPQTDLSQALSSSGRTNGYLAALQLLFEHPFVGYGFSRDYISSLLGFEIPHLSILQYAVHGGILYSFLLYLNQLLIYSYAAKNKSIFAWLIAIIVVGTCLVPDMFATRFLTIITMVALMEPSHNLERVPFFCHKFFQISNT